MGMNPSTNTDFGTANNDLLGGMSNNTVVDRAPIGQANPLSAPKPKPSDDDLDLEALLGDPTR